MRKRELERRLVAAEERFYDWQNSAPPPWGAGGFSIATPYASIPSTVGLPAAAAAIRLLSESTGMIPLKVIRGSDPASRVPARDSWQWQRLHDAPNDGQSAFDFWQDTETALETSGNSYLWKAISRRPVRSAEDIQLFQMDPTTVKVKWGDGHKKVFEVWANGEKKEYGTDQILHIRGWTLSVGSAAGVSPITLHREALGKYLATEEFESRFFTNSAKPPGVIQVPGDLKTGEADELRQLWYERYGGLSNAHTPAILKNGATWQSIGLSLQDAQFIEQKRYGTEDIARIFRISAIGLLGAYTQGMRLPTVDEDFHLFLEADMGPRMRRIESALRADPDLFPPTEDLFPEFYADAVLRPNVQARYAAYKDAAQGGWLTGNEIREKENLPPHPDGTSLQQTPVGGAPNQSVTPSAGSNGSGMPGQMAPMDS